MVAASGRRDITFPAPPDVSSSRAGGGPISDRLIHLAAAVDTATIGNSTETLVRKQIKLHNVHSWFALTKDIGRVHSSTSG